MTIIELKNMIADLPDDMDVMIVKDDIYKEDGYYGQFSRKAFRAKVKLVARVDGFLVVQSRPQKDDEARLSFCIE